MSLDFTNSNVDKSLSTISISSVLGLLAKEFDKQGIAEKTYNKHFNDADSEYYKKSVEEIIAMWEAKGAASCKYGSLLDDYIGVNLTGSDTDKELYILDNDIDSDTRLKSLTTSFDNFYALLRASGDMEFVDREKTVYYKADENHLVKGRFDALFRNKRTGKWVVIDWKSSGSIDKTPNRWTENLLGPAKNYPSLNWYTYTMQLFFYKKTLIESGYLPEGTTPDDVEVMLVQLPGHICENGRDFMIHKAAFPYDSAFMDSLFAYAIKKTELLNKKQNA